VHDEAQPRGTHLAQSNPGDRRPGGGAGPLGRGRGSVVHILYRLYAKRRRALGYDGHTYAAAGVAPGDRHEHGAAPNAHAEAPEADRAAEANVPGHDRPGPYLLHPESYAHVTYTQCRDAAARARDANLRRVDADRVLPDESDG
jgi:hypothetical protein